MDGQRTEAGAPQHPAQSHKRAARDSSSMKIEPLSRDQILALPPAINIRTLAKIFGISEPVARERHRRGEWEQAGIHVLQLGAQYRVITADVRRVLGVSSDGAEAGGA